METVKIKLREMNKSTISISDLFKDKNNLIKLIDYSNKRNDYNLLNEYIDEYYKYICNIIDKSDKMIISYENKYYKDLMMSNLKYIDSYSTTKLSNDTYITRLTNLYDISSDYSKKFVKKIIKSNLDIKNNDLLQYTFIDNDLNILVDYFTKNRMLYDYRDNSDKITYDLEREERVIDFVNNKVFISFKNILSRLKFILN